MNFKRAAALIAARITAAFIACSGLTACVSSEGNGPVINTLNALGYSTYNPEMSGRLRSVCASTAPLSLVLNDGKGDTFLVQSYDEGKSCTFQGAIQDGLVRFQGNYRKDHQYLGGGMHINNVSTYGHDTQPPPEGIMERWALGAVDVTDHRIFVEGRLPQPSCRTLSNGGAYGVFEMLAGPNPVINLRNPLGPLFDGPPLVHPYSMMHIP